MLNPFRTLAISTVCYKQLAGLKNEEEVVSISVPSVFLQLSKEGRATLSGLKSKMYTVC